MTMFIKNNKALLNGGKITKSESCDVYLAQINGDDNQQKELHVDYFVSVGEYRTNTECRMRQ